MCIYMHIICLRKSRWKPTLSGLSLGPAWHHLQGLEDGADRGAAAAKIGHLVPKDGDFTENWVDGYKEGAITIYNYSIL